MTNLKLLTMSAAIATIAGVGGLTGTSAFARTNDRPVVVEGHRINPGTQRVVLYGDLNLAFRADQRVLNQRIYTAARDICWHIGSFATVNACTVDAVASTDDQVATAIDRAKTMMAGVPVGPPLAISMAISSE